jgi:hypothetical protein
MPFCVQSQPVPKHTLVLEFAREVNVTESPLLMRPHLLIAALCERFILEGDGTLTMFRIIDRFAVNGTTEEFPPTLLQFTIVVKFASGSMRGRYNLSLMPIDPDKVPMQTFTYSLLFEGDDERGIQLVGPVGISVKQEGLYWIKVLVEKDEQTMIPFRVVYQRQPTIQMGS